METIKQEAGMYAICRTEKYHSTDLSKIQGHHTRNKDSYASNPDIDPEMSKYNKTNLQDMANEVKRRCVEFNPKSNAVMCFETIITASPEFFPKDWKEKVKAGEDFKKTREWEYMNTLAHRVTEKFGRENCVGYALHLDEKTPHLSLIFIPRTNDGRLCAKEVIGPKSLTELQDLAGEVGKPYGLERGTSRDAKERKKHLSTKEYKAEKDKEATAAKIEKIQQSIQRLYKAVKREKEKILEEYNKLRLSVLRVCDGLSREQKDEVMGLIEKFKRENLEAEYLDAGPRA